MISIRKEEEIRSLLSSGMSANSIAQKVGVSHWTVDEIRNSIETVNSLPAEKVQEIACMLRSGVSARAVVSSLKIQSSIVRAVRRYYYLYAKQPGSKGPEKCPTCGNMMQPESQTRKNRKFKNPSFLSISHFNMTELYRIATEVIDLYDLGVIANPLLYYLARRAEKTLEDIDGESSDDAKVACEEC